ncbi:MAG TPA: hypothetical protein VIV60_36635 [Polyangiaceae bacterium]
MDLAQIILALALAHGHTDHARLAAVADDIAVVSRTHPVLCGDARVDGTALLLAAVAEHESGWHPGVQDGSRCMPGSIWCDRGQAISLYQLRSPAWLTYSRERINADHRLSAELAARVLMRYRKRATVRELFVGYATGGRVRQCKAADEIAAIFETLARKSGIRVSFERGCLTARYVK